MKAFSSFYTKKTFSFKTYLFLFITIFSISASASFNFEPFDRGPDPDDPMQRELVTILSELPYLPGISEQLQVLTPAYRKGQKTRHFTVLFPQAYWADFDYLFNNIHKILLPNGRIRIYFDSTSLMKMVKFEAEKKGLKTSVGETNKHELKNVPSSFTENPFETRFPKLEITFGLKKAILDKEKRRNWPK